MEWRFKYFNEPWDVLRKRFTWIADMHGVPQDPIHHAEGDVAIHTEMVRDALRNLPEFKDLPEQTQHILDLSALMHDMEKRSTTVHEPDGRITSNRHTIKGETTARMEMYKDLEVPFYVRETIAKIVRHHGFPLWAIEKPNLHQATVDVSLRVDTKLLAMFAKADVLGRICSDQKELLMRIDMFEELCKELDCYGKPRAFPDELTRFTYLNSSEPALEYIPFDDTKFEVTVMCGLPGAGKDHYIQKNLKGVRIVSIDDVRRAGGYDPTKSKDNGQAVQETKKLAEEALRAGESFIWNGTNTTRDMRSMVISKFLERFNPKCRVKIVYVETPYKDLLRQNMDRANPIPITAIDRLIRKLDMPAYNESHDLKIVLNNP